MSDTADSLGNKVYFKHQLNKKESFMERRSEKRKNIEVLEVEHIIDNNSLKKICTRGQIVDTSIKGFLISVERQDLLSNDLKGNLTLEKLKGYSLSLYIPQMDLELDGTVGLTRHRGQGIFEILIHFSDDTPRYWRECLMDLLPEPNEVV